MTGEDLTRVIPHGIKWEFKGKQLVVYCPSCQKRWKGDRLGDPRNRDWLRKHLDEHAHAVTTANFLLHNAPDD